MALIKCPECQSEVSDQAPTCPKCGFPFKKEPSSSGGVQRVVVDQVKNVELTNKKWKIMKLIFWPMFLVGIFLCLSVFPVIMMHKPGVSISPNSITAWGIGIFFAFIGLIGVLVATLGAWWHHR